MYEKDIDARSLWNKIIHNAWKSAEPGVLFWDTILRESVPDCYADLGFRTVSTNPCGEIPLCPYDSCRLMAINLYGYVDEPFTKNAKFNFDRFKKHIAQAMRMMDDIIDLELEKVNQILAKISKDPEDEDIRSVEVSLWEDVYKRQVEALDAVLLHDLVAQSQAIGADELSRRIVPDEKLAVVAVVTVCVDVVFRPLADFAEGYLAQPADLVHQVRDMFRRCKIDFVLPVAEEQVRIPAVSYTHLQTVGVAG